MSSPTAPNTNPDPVTGQGSNNPPDPVPSATPPISDPGSINIPDFSQTFTNQEPKPSEAINGSANNIQKAVADISDATPSIPNIDQKVSEVKQVVEPIASQIDEIKEPINPEPVAETVAEMPVQTTVSDPVLTTEPVQNQNPSLDFDQSQAQQTSSSEPQSNLRVDQNLMPNTDIKLEGYNISQSQTQQPVAEPPAVNEDKSLPSITQNISTQVAPQEPAVSSTKPLQAEEPKPIPIVEEPEAASILKEETIQINEVQQPLSSSQTPVINDSTTIPKTIAELAQPVSEITEQPASASKPIEDNQSIPVYPVQIDVKPEINQQVAQPIQDIQPVQPEQPKQRPELPPDVIPTLDELIQANTSDLGSESIERSAETVQIPNPPQESQINIPSAQNVVENVPEVKIQETNISKAPEAVSFQTAPVESIQNTQGQNFSSEAVPAGMISPIAEPVGSGIPAQPIQQQSIVQAPRKKNKISTIIFIVIFVLIAVVLIVLGVYLSPHFNLPFDLNFIDKIL